MRIAVNKLTEQPNGLKDEGHWLANVGKSINAGKATIVLILIVVVIYAILSVVVSSINVIGTFTIFLGTAILISGYYHLIYVLPGMAKEVKTGLAEELLSRVCMQAVRVSFWLVILGIVIIFLGSLHLMGVIPSWAQA